tara:strand:- start:25305 stop:26831 length:1527 start_codon:yes stop_codon:yes gene_type:complete
MTAISSDRVSKTVGYKILKGNFRNTTPNLPQKIAVLAEANTANQTGLDLDGVDVTSAQQAATLYGYGSPAHQALRILKPLSGGGVGSIPITVYPQAEQGGAAEKVITVTPTGTATANATHFIVVNGRTGVDGQNYSFNVETGDDEAVISGKISDAINAVLSSPVIGTTGVAPDVAIATSKWKGITADDITVTIDTQDNAAGIVYASVSTASGSGLPAVTPALGKFGNEWNTIVLNSYGTNSTVMDELEAFNGVADPSTPTGRYSADVFKPFVALTGTTDADLAALKVIGNARKIQMTIALCVAPNSLSLPLEVAANMAEKFALIAQDNPHLDVQDLVYRDIHVPLTSIGDMENSDDRDLLVKAGVSTVQKINGNFVITDFVSTYHPDGELPPQFRYPRNINIDWNIRFGELLLVETFVIGKAIAGNFDIVSVGEVIKPSGYKQILFSYAEDLSKRALISDAKFMQKSIVVEIDGTNPDRLNSEFSYKRTGYARIVSTEATAGFNFGNS